MSQEAAAYFRSRPDWKRQMEAIRKKYRTSGKASGNMRLSDATAEECRAAGLFFGKTFTPPLLCYRLADFDRALAASRFCDTSLSELLEGYFGAPVRVKREEREERINRMNALFDWAFEQAGSEVSRGWIDRMAENKDGGYRLFIQTADREEEAARTALKQVCLAIDCLVTQPPQRRRLAVFSAKITANPHAFDSDRLAGKLLLYALCDWRQCVYPRHAEQRAAILFSVELIADDISSFTVQSGLYMFTEQGEEHPAFKAFRELGEGAVLTMSALSGIAGATSPDGRVYIVENQMVFSHLCEQAAAPHSPIVCTSGQIKTASLLLLDLLAASGCTLYYSGDFDPEGLRIADRLAIRYPGQLEFWHYGCDDYAACLSDETISEQRLSELETLTSAHLRTVAAELMTIRRAGYQELLLKRLVQDLSPAAGKDALDRTAFGVL